jgi:hypothetical protein
MLPLKQSRSSDATPTLMMIAARPTCRMCGGCYTVLAGQCTSVRGKSLLTVYYYTSIYNNAYTFSFRRSVYSVSARPLVADAWILLVFMYYMRRKANLKTSHSTHPWDV